MQKYPQSRDQAQTNAFQTNFGAPFGSNVNNNSSPRGYPRSDGGNEFGSSFSTNSPSNSFYGGFSGIGNSALDSPLSGRSGDDKYVLGGNSTISSRPGGNTLYESRIIPSHLTHMQYKSYTPDKSSPLATERPLSRFSSSDGSKSQNSGQSSSSFGGPSFGMRRSALRSSSGGIKSDSVDDEPILPVNSIYDFPSSTNSSHEPAMSPSRLAKRNVTEKSLVESDKEPTDVTLFGFPPSMTSQVLTTFARYGEILEHSTSMDNGDASFNSESGENWIKIKYAHPTSAIRATQASGSFVGSYMVGCIMSQSEGNSLGGRTMLGSNNTYRNKWGPKNRSGLSNDDQMDLDSLSNSPASFKTNIEDSTLYQSGDMGTPSKTTPYRNLPFESTPAYKKIEVYGAEGIFKSDEKKKNNSWFSMLVNSPHKPPVNNKVNTNSAVINDSTSVVGSSWLGRFGKYILDSIFGF